MSKDPAVLFYTADFRQGTTLLSDEQVGQYIRLLCDQHQNGHLPDQHMINVCRTYDNPVFNKFIKDEKGCWYNKRMQEETEKRVSYCESRRKARLIGIEIKKNKQHTLQHTLQRMDNENEDDNINVIDNDNSSLKTKRGKIFIKPTLNEVAEYIQENKYTVNPEKWYSYYESNGWKIGKNSMKNWQACVRTWQHNNLDNVKKIGLVD